MGPTPDEWYNFGYTMSMKTAISIPDELFVSADLLAKRLGISRSELYATAVLEFVERLRADKVTERLNEIYATEGSSLDPALAKLQYRTLAKRLRRETR